MQNDPTPPPSKEAGSGMTKSQREALKWLSERNGDGCFDVNGVLLAAGESAPFMRSTWNALRSLGLVEIYKPNGKGRGRVRVLPPRSLP